MSRLVSRQSDGLESFIFLPTSHKGGRMVRPHYWRSDRSTTMIFPSLHTIGYYDDCGTPLDALWVVPNLENLYVFLGRGESVEDMLRDWSIRGTNDDEDNSTAGVLGREAESTRSSGKAEQAWEECPNLKEIICGKPDFSRPLRFQILRRLVPPCPLPGGVLRLLDIVVAKEDEATCPMAKLHKSVMDLVVSFCHKQEWEIFDYQEAN